MPITGIAFLVGWQRRGPAEETARSVLTRLCPDPVPQLQDNTNGLRPKILLRSRQPYMDREEVVTGADHEF